MAAVDTRSTYSIPSLPNHVALWYALACFVSLLTANFALDRVQTRDMQAIKSSTLFYASKDQTSSALATLARLSLHIRTVDLLAPDSGMAVFRLTGIRTATSPTLVIPQGNSLEIVSGPYAVNKALQPAMSEITPVQLAKRALLVMTGLILLAFVFASEVSAIISFLPVVGLVAVSALWGHCLNCNFGDSTLSALAPLLELAYLAAGVLLFTVPAFQHRVAYAGFLLVSGLIPVVQASMLVAEPKFCPACLIITFVSAAYFVATLKTMASSELTGVAAPPWVRVALSGLLALVLIRHSLVLAGYVSLGKPMEEVIPTIIGSPLSKFVPSMPSQPGVLYVVTLENCDVCKKAEEDLPGMGIAWRKVPVCTIMTRDGCFEGRGLSFPAPMLLMCGKNGRIIFQHEGWFASPQDQSDLKAQIQNLQKRVARQ